MVYLSCWGLHLIYLIDLMFQFYYRNVTYQYQCRYWYRYRYLFFLTIGYSSRSKQLFADSDPVLSERFESAPVSGSLSQDVLFPGPQIICIFSFYLSNVSTYGY
jgi:hypothetical protein